MQEEKAASLAAAEEAGEPPALLPQSYDSLRLVPSYAAYINERFERCLDLYLCPRTRRCCLILVYLEGRCRTQL